MATTAEIDSDFSEQHDPDPTRGWGWPMLSKKAHYFVDDRSLCGKWLFSGYDVGDHIGKPGPDDCKACWKKLDRLTELNGE